MNKFNIGDIVVVITNCAKKGNTGVIKSIKINKYNVTKYKVLDCKTNTLGTFIRSSLIRKPLHIYIPKNNDLVWLNIDDTIIFTTHTGIDIINDNKSFIFNNEMYDIESYLGCTIAFKNVLYFRVPLIPVDTQVFNWFPHMKNIGTPIRYDKGLQIIHMLDGEYQACDLNLTLTTMKRVLDIEEQIEISYTEVIKQTTDMSIKFKRYGLCFSLAYYDEHNKFKIVSKTHAACHWSIATFISKEDKNSTEAICVIQYLTDKLLGNTEVKNKVSDAWLEWVIKDSPWSRNIITKTLEEAKVHGVLVRTDIASNALMCTLCALRYVGEFYSDICNWYDTYNKYKCNKSMAFFLVLTDFGRIDSKGHHNLLNTYAMGDKEVKQFITTGNPTNSNKIYNKSFTYGGISIHHAVEITPIGFKSFVSEFNKNNKDDKVFIEHKILGRIRDYTVRNNKNKFIDELNKLIG